MCNCSKRIMLPVYMAEHAGECVKISDDGQSFVAVPCGGGGGTIYGPYASNADAITAGRSVGDLYKSTTQIFDSPIILQVV